MVFRGLNGERYYREITSMCIKLGGRQVTTSYPDEIDSWWLIGKGVDTKPTEGGMSFSKVTYSTISGSPIVQNF